MDEIGKLDRILNEEDGNVVADEVEIALVSIEFDGEASGIAGACPLPPRRRRRSRTARTVLFSCLSQQGTKRALDEESDGHLKVTVSPRATRVNNTFWNSLMVEMRDFLAESKILQERRTPLA
jgi:hypothetical protein